MANTVSITISALSLAISSVTAWLTPLSPWHCEDDSNDRHFLWAG
jgi:hypothetical protein